MTTHQPVPVRVWTRSEVRSLKWSTILVGVGVGLFLPSGLRRYGRLLALATAALAIKPLRAMFREDTLLTSDRPTHVDPHDNPADEGLHRGEGFAAAGTSEGTRAEGVDTAV